MNVAKDQAQTGPEGQEKTAARQAAEITREAVPGIRSDDLSLRAMAEGRPMFAAIRAELAKLEAEPEAGG